jgi:hypothetical protein
MFEISDSIYADYLVKTAIASIFLVVGAGYGAENIHPVKLMVLSLIMTGILFSTFYVSGVWGYEISLSFAGDAVYYIIGIGFWISLSIASSTIIYFMTGKMISVVEFMASKEEEIITV